MAELRSDGERRDDSALAVLGAIFDPEELRRRNAISVGMDVLFLVTTGVFAHAFARGFWPAVIAAVPLGAFLYFGWNSSKAFFLAQALTVAGVAAATLTGALSP